jgi:uncharacterized protein
MHSTKESTALLTPTTLFDFRFTNIAALVIKVTARCNLDCAYCYENITNTEADMPIDTFKTIIGKALYSTNEKTVTCIFHGGEPTLLKDEWFTAAIDYGNHVARQAGKRVRYALQSNFVKLPAERMRLFKELRISVGVSIDGPPDLNNAMRRRAEKVIDNYFLAQRVGLQTGILMTINHTNFQHFTAINHWLFETMKVKHYKANVVSNVGAGYGLATLQPAFIFEAQKAIIDYLIATKGEAVVEENIAAEIIHFFDRKKEVQSTASLSLCKDKTCGAGKRVMGITAKGNILPCGRFQWNDESYFLGTLQDTNTHTSSTSFDQKVNNFHALVPETWYDCKDCEAATICSYGCQAFIVRAKEKANVDCLPTKMRFAYFKEKEAELKVVYQQLVSNENMQDVQYKDSSGGSNRDVKYKDQATYRDSSPGRDDYNDTKYSDYSDYKDYKDSYKDYSDYSDYSDS